MKSYINAVLCAGLILVMPSIQAESSQKSEWITYAQHKISHSYLLANRLCDADLFLVWPILASVAGYNYMEAIDLFMKVNAGRLVLNVATQHFDQMDQARTSLSIGFVMRVLNEFMVRMAPATI